VVEFGRLLRFARNDKDWQALKEGAVFSDWIYPSAVSMSRASSSNCGIQEIATSGSTILPRNDSISVTGLRSCTEGVSKGNDRDWQALTEGAVFSGWIYPSAISKGS